MGASLRLATLYFTTNCRGYDNCQTFPMVNRQANLFSLLWGQCIWDFLRYINNEFSDFFFYAFFTVQFYLFSEWLPARFWRSNKRFLTLVEKDVNFTGSQASFRRMARVLFNHFGVSDELFNYLNHAFAEIFLRSGLWCVYQYLRLCLWWMGKRTLLLFLVFRKPLLFGLLASISFFQIFQIHVYVAPNAAALEQGLYVGMYFEGEASTGRVLVPGDTPKSNFWIDEYMKERISDFTNSEPKKIREVSAEPLRWMKRDSLRGVYSRKLKAWTQEPSNIESVNRAPKMSWMWMDDKLENLTWSFFHKAGPNGNSWFQFQQFSNQIKNPICDEDQYRCGTLRRISRSDGQAIFWISVTGTE